MSIDNLFHFEDNWVTNVGSWHPGKGVTFREYDLFNDLNETSWMELLLYGITNRRFNHQQIELFNRMWVLCTSYPDPRIWNNRITALAGTARSTCSLAIGAATAISEATIYGRRPDIRALDFLMKTQVKLNADEKLDDLVIAEIKKYRGIAGYGRPIINVDERIIPIMNEVDKLGFKNGTYIKLAFEIEKSLSKTPWKLAMNVGAVLAALSADMGLKPREHYQFMTLCFSAGMFPCYIDCANKPEGAFFPLRCERIKYEGPAPRKWPQSH